MLVDIYVLNIYQTMSGNFDKYIVYGLIVTIMFIGIDLGTSSVKAILINSNQNTLASHTEPIELLNPKNGYYEQNPEEWVKATFLCFEKIPKPLISINKIPRIKPNKTI